MSPRIDREQRRSEILDAALTCFLRSGYTGTSMDDIVRESGLSKGTLYWHFTNKQELFLALFDRIIGQMVAMVDIRTDGTESYGDVLQRVIMAFSFLLAPEAASELTAPLKFLVELWQEEAFMAHYRAVMTPIAAEISGLIKAGIAAGEFRPVDAEALAWGLLALGDGLLIYAVTNMPGDRQGQLAVLADLILAGIQAPPRA